MCFVPPRVGSSCCNSDGRLGEEEEGQSRESNALTTNMKIADREERHRPPLPESTPWLVFPHGEDQTFCSILEDKYILKSIPEFHRKSFVASYHGWIVLSGNNDGDNDNHYYLWNPVTLETINLPPLKSELAIEIRACVLSSPPGGNSNCTLLLFHYPRPLISFCRPGDQQWDLYNYEEQLRIILGSEEGTSFMNVAPFKGELYALTSEHLNMVIIIDVDEPNCLTMRCLCIDEYGSVHTNATCSTSYLIESSGELLHIVRYYRGITLKEVSAIIVHRMDLDKKVWVKVKSLKDRVIFLGGNCSVSCPAYSGFDGSRIYFTMESDGSLYSFNLEDDSLAVSLPCSHLPTPRPSPFWLSPDIRLMTHIGAEGKQKIKIEEQHNIKDDDKGGDKEYDNNLKEVEDEQREEAGNLDNINLDILSVVADDLNLFDYSNFRSTCRLFRTAAPPLSRKTVQSKLNAQTICPRFMFWKNNNDGVGKVTVPMNGDTFMMNIPELLLGDSICFCSNDGWVLMTKDRRTMFFNPLTREIGEYYPTLHSDILEGHILGIGFSSAMVTSMDCMMVIVSSHIFLSSSGELAYGFRVNYIRFGEQEWDYMIFEGDESPELGFIPKTNPVFWYGDFYMIDQRGYLGALEITREDCVFDILADPPKLPCESFDSCFLLVHEGELLSVFVGHFGKWVRIYYFNGATCVWVEVESLPNHVLFLSKWSASSCARTPGGAGNRIYFSRFRDQSMVYYDLETRKYHSAGHEEDPLEDFYGTREHFNCAWFEPKL